MSDIRAVTSASNFFRRRLCVGSAHEEAKYGPEPDTEFSDEGRLLHRYFMTLEMPEILTLPQREVLSLANHYGRSFGEQVMAQEAIGEDAEMETDREVALIFRDGPTELMPGHADIVYTWRGRGVRVIIDAKFGMGEVEEAPTNDQLAIYACMTQQADPVERTHVAIVQPRNFGKRMTTAVYDADAIEIADSSIAADFYRSQKGGPLTAGSHCHFCRAKVKCEEYGKTMFALYAPSSRAIETLENPELIRLHEAIQFANKIKDQVHDEIRLRIESERITELKLGNSGDKRTVINPAGLFQAFMNEFKENPKWSASKFDQCRDIVWGRLETYVRELTGSSEKKAVELIKTISEPFITATPNQKKIQRVK